MANAEDTKRPKKTDAERAAWLAAKNAEIAARKKAEPIELPGDLMPQSQQQPGDDDELMWPNSVRGVPNAVLRSALFGVIKRGKRAYQEGVKKASVAGVTVIHTGPQLDQADLDVWEHCLHLARIEGTGKKIHFGLGYFLKDIGRSTGGKDSEWLKNSLRRLSASVIEITDGKRTYWGAMLFRGVRDEETGQHVIEMNPDIVRLYGVDGWTGIEYETRRALKNQPLAQWLHGFYSSHARPFAMKVETIHRLCGSETKLLKHFRSDLRDTLVKLAEATGWTCEIYGDDLVHVTKTPSLAQRKHLEKLGKSPRIATKSYSQATG